MFKLEKSGLLLDLSGPWGNVKIEGIRSALVTENTYLLTGQAERTSVKGGNLRCEWNLSCCSSSLLLSLVVSKGFSPGETIISGEITNPSRRPVYLKYIYPFIVRTLAVGTVHLGNKTDHLKVFVMSPGAGGYTTRVESFQGDVRPVEYGIRDSTEGVTSSGLTLLYLPDGEVSLGMGFLDFSSQAGNFNIQYGYSHGRKTVTELTAELEYMKPLAPGKTVHLSPLWLAAGNDPFEILERYACRLRDNMRIQLSKDVPCGWISWYAYREKLNAKIVRANARVQSRTMLNLGGSLCHLDLGWNKDNRPGDWLETDRRYPEGIQNLCGYLTDRGFKVALWSTPLLVSEKSQVVKEHPEWLLRGGSGRPVSFGRWYWEPFEECYCLDPTLPSVREHVRRVYETLRGWGAEAFKLDFSAAFDLQIDDDVLVRKPPYAGKDMTRMEACRKLYGTIRDAIGGAHMTVCNAPWQGVVGVADSIFLANDVGNLTDSESGDERPDRRKWEYFRERTRQIFSRYFFNGVVWWGNPDCFVAENDASENHSRARLQVVMLAGGQYKCSNQLPEWKQERMRAFLKGLPHYGVAARPVDLFESDYPAVLDLPVCTNWSDWHVIGVFNWGDSTERISLDLSKLRPSVRGKQVVWDFWDENLLGIFSTKCSVKIPAESATLLCVRPLDSHPILISTDIHFTMGGVEVPECIWDGGKRCLYGRARRAAGDSGTLFFYLPPGYSHKKARRLSGNTGSILALKINFTRSEERWTVQF